MEKTENNEIIIYQPDETLRLDVQVGDDTVWLSQAQMVELFQTTKQNISLHINNIFKEGELNSISVVKNAKFRVDKILLRRMGRTATFYIHA